MKDFTPLQAQLASGMNPHRFYRDVYPRLIRVRCGGRVFVPGGPKLERGKLLRPIKKVRAGAATPRPS